MTELKRLMYVTIVCVMLLMLSVPAIAQDEGTTAGEFTLANSDPTVGSVALWTTVGTPAETMSMTPQVEYNVKVAVTDYNTLDDLSTVQVTIFYDTDGAYAALDENCSADTQNCAILTWTNGGAPPWTMSPSASTTWSIETGNCVTPTLTSSTGTFEFHFKPGKVATETPGTDKWHIYAKADDGGGTPGSNTQQIRTMDWYAEITINTAAVNWGSVSPGMDFAEGDPSEEVGISVTYLANGDYDEKVKSETGTWSGAPSGTATLSADDTPGPNEFALKADDTGTMGSGEVLVSTSYQAIDETGAQTGETGDTVATNSLWLKLGTPFTDAVYTGTIYCQIADGS